MTLAPTSIVLDHKNSRRLASGQHLLLPSLMTSLGGLGQGPQDMPRVRKFGRHPHGNLHVGDLAPSSTLGAAPKRVNGDNPPKGRRRYACGRTG